MDIYKLNSEYQTAGGQEQAIEKLSNWVNEGQNDMTLHGITGSGKTFTMANVIARTNRPALIYSPNKILAYQLYEEMKSFFPENEVHYYVSSFDFYIPEFVKNNEYHAKQSILNDILYQMILDTTNALISGRKDLIIVTSSACLFGTGAKEMYSDATIRLDLKRMKNTKEDIKMSLIHAGYTQSMAEPKRGEYQELGRSLVICAREYEDLRHHWLLNFSVDNELKAIHYNHETITTQEIIHEERNLLQAAIHPATRFAHGVYTPDELEIIANKIRDEAQRQKYRLNPDQFEFLNQKIEEDIASILSSGYCNGIENYSWYFNRNNLYREYNPDDYENMQPYTLMSNLHEDTLVFVDESHLSLGQISGCSFADFSRKRDLIKEGIRLPSCVINRPLKKIEWDLIDFSKCYVSATPGEEEITRSQGRVAELIIRPTYLLDPEVEIVYKQDLQKQSLNVSDHVISEIKEAIAQGGGVLLRCDSVVSCKEYLRKLVKFGIRAKTMLGENSAPERRELVERLQGDNPAYEPLDVIIGVNLIREGLDIPRVSRVLILNVDYGGFLNDERSLIQVIGRAARNVNGRVVLYASKPETLTPAVLKAVEITKERREKQQEYNRLNNKTPKSVVSTSYKNISLIDKTYIPEVEDILPEDKKA